MSILEIRRKIDAIDDQLLELLEKRAELAREIGEEKRRTQIVNSGRRSEGAPAFYDPAREKQVLARLARGSRGSFPKNSIPFVFREVMSACRSLEADLRVAFLGPQGTYSQIAAHQIFGHSVSFVAAPSIDAVFAALKRGESEYGVVPYENSYEGCVPATLEALLHSDVRIQSELYLRIHHCLLSKQKSLTKIRRVISHPQGLAQCREWLREHLPRAELVTASSTAEAARRAAKEPSSAAIASRLSGDLFKLHCLKEGIQDQAGNATRFFVIVREDNENARPAPTSNDRTTLLLLSEPPRATRELPKALELLGGAGARVLRLESRASGQGSWGQAYFVDVEGHAQDEALARALERVRAEGIMLRVLGSYPAQQSP